MVEITSRAELEAWLKGAPIEFSQAIAARSALRVLPYAYSVGAPKEWVSEYALCLIRAVLISSLSSDLPTIDITNAADRAGGAVALAATRAASRESNSYYYMNAARAATSAAFSAAASFKSYAVARAIRATRQASLGIKSDKYAIEWTNVLEDCRNLVTNGVSKSTARSLMSEKLHLAGEQEGWRNAWLKATEQLETLDPSYQVWIDWYNRRVRGEEAAFYIPGDIDRTNDKSILARLADATDENFWGKGATYVNTTLQSWIDEARIEARLDAAIAEIQRGANPDYSRPETSAARTEALREIDRLLVEPSDPRLKIGGNQPPEDIDPEERPVVLPPAIRDSIIAIKDDLQAIEPDAAKIAEKSKLLLRLIKWRADIADVTGEHFAKGFGEEFGKQVAGDVYKLVRLAVLGLLAIIALFLSRSLGIMF